MTQTNEEEAKTSRVLEARGLPEDLKNILNKNSRELNMIEGNILGAAKDRELKTLLITSSLPFEGKTISAINIAYALSEKSNAKVLLVDGNLPDPMIHKMFGVASVPGLSDLFVSNAKYGEVIRKTQEKCLWIITSGSKIPNTSAVFRSKYFRKNIAFLRQKFDYVIFDGRSILTSSDASIIASCFDGVILVTQCERTRQNAVIEAQTKIDNVKGNLVGIVLNRRKYYIPRAFYGWI